MIMKKIILLIAFIGLIHECFAQITEITVDSVRNYAIAKIVNVFLESYFKNNKTNKKSDTAAYNAKLNDYNSNIKRLFDANSITKPMSVDLLSGLLTKNFNPTKEKFVDRAKTVKIAMNKPAPEMASQLIEGIYKKSNIDFEAEVTNLKNDLIQDVAAFFETKIKEASNDTKPSTSPAIARIAPPPIDTAYIANAIENQLVLMDSPLKFHLNFWNLLSPITICMALVLFFYFKSNNRLTRHREEIQALKDRPIATNDNKGLNYSENLRISQLENKITQLDSIVTQLKTANLAKDKKSAFTQIENNERHSNNNSPIVQNVSRLDNSAFYMSTPIEDFFSITSKSDEYKKGATMYKFFPNGNMTEAKFEFISDEETIKYIKNNFLEVVRPACKFENSPSANTRTVETIEKGVARLEGNNWKIVEKARIKFE